MNSPGHPGVSETPGRFDGPPSLAEVLEVLRSYQPRAGEVGVELVGVVGSVARGEAGPESDVDVVFDVISELDYWRLGGLQMDIQDSLNRPVDLVDRQMLPPDRWAWMGRDMAPL